MSQADQIKRSRKSDSRELYFSCIQSFAIVFITIYICVLLNVRYIYFNCLLFVSVKTLVVYEVGPYVIDLILQPLLPFQTRLEVKFSGITLVFMYSFFTFKGQFCHFAAFSMSALPF